MSRFTKAFIKFVVAAFVLVGLTLLYVGAVSSGLFLLGIALLVACIGGVGEFFVRHPLPPGSLADRNVFVVLRRCRQHYGGWRGTLVFYGGLGLVALSLVARAIKLMP